MLPSSEMYGEIELRRGDLRRILLVEVAHLHDVRVPEQRVRIEVELRIERDHAPVAGDDQRIDLRERRIVSSNAR
jgi:hypothetical protein